MLIKGDRPVILCVNQQCIGYGRRGHDTAQGIGQQSRPHAAALKSRIHSKTADTDSRNTRIAGKLLDEFRWQVGQRNARGGQRVVSGNSAGYFFNGDKAGRYTAADILRGLSLKVPVKRLLATRKGSPLMRIT